MIKINENIKAIRISKRLKQNEVAEKLKISAQGYQAIESGKASVTFERLQELATIFGMNVKEVINYPDRGNDERVKELEGKIKDLENDKKRFSEFSDERKKRLIELEKLTSKVADCLEMGYAILSKNEVIEKQSPEIQKEIQDFVRLYDRLEEQIKIMNSQT